MIQVNVSNSLTGINYSAIFSDSTSANTWITQQQIKNSWGRPQRQVSSLSLEISSENINLATSNQHMIDSFGNPYILYTFPSDYTITQTDITVQYNQQQLVQKALTNQSTGALIIANVTALNESLLLAGTMTQTTFNALLADQNVLNIERLLWNGSLVTAKALIKSTNLSAYYNTSQINQILMLFPS